MADVSAAALRYDPSFEHVAENESKTIDELVDAMRSISQTTFDDFGHANRSVHAKAHALLKGELTVLDGLPEPLAQGIFASAGSYPVIMRISTNPGDILDDKVSLPRGLGLKVIGVAGARLPGSEAMATQDFVMINAPAFAAPDAAGFLKIVKLLAGTTDKAPALKKALSTVLRGAETALEAVGGKSGTLISLGGHPLTNPAGETFYTQVPHRHGPYMAKLSLAPVSADLCALTNAKVDLDGKPNGLREALVAFFATHGGTWELRVQLLTDRDTMPVEDASKPWPEDKSPYMAVARIEVPPQSAYDEARHRSLDEAIAFSPWHGIEAHRPIGSIMRARKPAYEMSSGFRASHNKCPIHEPRTAADIAG